MTPARPASTQSPKLRDAGRGGDQLETVSSENLVRRRKEARARERSSMTCPRPRGRAGALAQVASTQLVPELRSHQHNSPPLLMARESRCSGNRVGPNAELGASDQHQPPERRRSLDQSSGLPKQPKCEGSDPCENRSAEKRFRASLALQAAGGRRAAGTGQEAAWKAKLAADSRSYGDEMWSQDPPSKAQGNPRHVSWNSLLSSPIANNYHQGNGFKEHKLSILQFCRLEV